LEAGQAGTIFLPLPLRAGTIFGLIFVSFGFD
jgi:hypothetical protein